MTLIQTGRSLTRDVARKHGRELSDDEMDWVLWEHTAFPMASAGYVIAQLHTFFAQYEASEGGV